MTAIDMQLLFDDKIGRFMDKDMKIFLSTEVERFLTTSQNNFIQAMADVYEYNEKARKSLTKFTQFDSVTPTSITGFVPISPTSETFIPPTNCIRIVEEQAVTATDKIAVIPITHDQYLANRKNPYKQPYKDLVWRLDVDGHVELVPDATTTITAWEVRYIKQPDDVEFDDDTDLLLLDPDVDKVVDLAVELAVKSLAVGRPKEN